MCLDLRTIDWIAISSIVTAVMAFFTFRALRAARRANDIAEKALKENVRQRQYEHTFSTYRSLLDEISKIQLEVKDYLLDPNFHLDRYNFRVRSEWCKTALLCE